VFEISAFGCRHNSGEEKFDGFEVGKFDEFTECDVSSWSW
jgi:hypothetical protein